MRLKTGDFRRSFSKSVALKREVFLFTHLLMIQIAQTAACNRFHVVAQRMARWMLMTRDRVNSNEFRITQEFLALMLGVRRVGISAAMSDLRERSLIVYSRGTITILDHEGLVALACGCYIPRYHQPAFVPQGCRRVLGFARARIAAAPAFGSRGEVTPAAAGVHRQ